MLLIHARHVFPKRYRVCDVVQQIPVQMIVRADIIDVNRCAMERCADDEIPVDEALEAEIEPLALFDD